jgi:transposase-like protein
MGTITTELVEDGEKRDNRGRRRMPQARQAELLKAYESSGLTMAAFARREGINYTTLAHWVAKQRRALVTAPAIRFAEVKLPLAGAAAPETAKDVLEVRLPDGTVVRGSCVAEVAALARALRS